MYVYGWKRFAADLPKIKANFSRSGFKDDKSRQQQSVNRKKSFKNSRLITHYQG